MLAHPNYPNNLPKQPHTKSFLVQASHGQTTETGMNLCYLLLPAMCLPLIRCYIKDVAEREALLALMKLWALNMSVYSKGWMEQAILREGV